MEIFTFQTKQFHVLTFQALNSSFLFGCFVCSKGSLMHNFLVIGEFLKIIIVIVYNY